MVLTSAGKSFCAAAISSVRLCRKTREKVAQSATLALLLRRLDMLKPLIGRINGPAYGGGVGMISICDYTIGAKTRFGLTGANCLLREYIAYVVARIGKVHRVKPCCRG